ncbi:pectate lyase [Pterulicium gracile]|uniref:Pectate lyase n=1 Tax=Pterulicium gracile TaxID=1884261 RepID=A0A5C3QFM5_9AGAR|nr:pectate lyase [Pterula gracilis]
MKFLASFVAFLAVTVSKRASVNDVANIGYATLNGGTSGGSGAAVFTINSLSALTSAIAGNTKKVVVVTGNISGTAIVKVGGNTTIVGRNGTSELSPFLVAQAATDVVVQQPLLINKVVGNAIGVQEASKVWIDHVGLWSDLDHDKDYYDGLLDITHGVTEMTVSYVYFHTHYEGTLVGHSDSNSSVDTKMTVTYAFNYFKNINSRTPSFRFGRGHIYNNVFDDNGDGINTRVGAQLLIQNNVWNAGNKKPLYSTDQGYAVATGNDFGGKSNTAPAGSFTSAPYPVSLIATGSVRSSVVGQAGATISVEGSRVDARSLDQVDAPPFEWRKTRRCTVVRK